MTHVDPFGFRVRKKVCLECGKKKEITQFHRDGRDADGSIRYRPRCKACHYGFEPNSNSRPIKKLKNLDFDVIRQAFQGITR